MNQNNRDYDFCHNRAALVTFRVCILASDHMLSNIHDHWDRTVAWDVCNSSVQTFDVDFRYACVQSLTKVLSLIHFVETTAYNLTFN